MTNKKITALVETTTLSDGDMLPVVVDVATTPTTKKVSFAGLRQSISSINPNLLTNGNFAVDQRHAFAINTPGTAVGWIADRWKAWRGALAGGFTVTDFVNNALDGRSNYVIMTRTVGDTSIQPMVISQDLESVDSKILQGQYLTLTVSNYFGAGAAGTLEILIRGGTGNDQTLTGTVQGGQTLASYTGPVVTGVQEVHTITTAVPLEHTYTQLFIKITYTPSTATAVASDFMLLYGAKLEIGKLFTGWSFPSYADTLAKCQRYYFKTFSNATAPANATPGEILFMQNTAASVGVYISTPLPCDMRVVPTVTIFNPRAAGNAIYNVSTSSAFSACSVYGSGGTKNVVLTGTPPAGSAIGNICTFQFTADAEL